MTATAYPARLRLEGLGYVVAGAGQGMGYEICHALAQAGASRVLCVDIDPARAARVAAEIGIGVPWVGDVTVRDDVARLAEAAAATLETVNGFVDVVGMARYASVLEIHDELFDGQFDICLRHAYLLSQELGRVMVRSGGGTMVFIASASGLASAPMHAAYGAAKAALIAWMKSLAVELGPVGIRANAIAPGVVLTPRMEIRFSQERRLAHIANTPLQRLASPAEIASVALFLTSDLSSYITGQTLIVDGGVAAKFPYPPL